MINDFGGVVKAEKLPNATSVNCYSKRDILFSNIRTYFKKVWLSTFEGTVSPDVLVFRSNPDKCLDEFLYYSLCNPVFTEYSVLTSKGAKMPRGDKEALLEYSLLIPPLPEQHAIAYVLSSLDDKIDLLHRQNQTLETLAETLFRHWFVEEAKEDWEEMKLRDFISIKHGFAFKGNNITGEPTNLILVTPGNFKIGGGFKFDKFKYYSSQDFPKDYIFQSGDLIVTMTDLSVDGNTLGYPAFVPENYSNELYLHNQRVGKIEFKNELGKNFIYQLMRTEDYQWFVLSGASGTAIRHTSPTSICNFSFRKPPKSKIIEFELFANSLKEKMKKNQIQIRTLLTLRDTLLPKLMSSEVRVKIV